MFFESIINLVLLSRHLRHDEVICCIMRTGEYFQDTFNMDFDEALEHAVFKRRFLIRNKLVVSAKEVKSSTDVYKSDSSMESIDNYSSDEENADPELECDFWFNINRQMNNKNVSDDTRTKRGSDFVLYCLRHVLAWRHDRIYKAIIATLKKHKSENIKMSYRKALMNAIHQTDPKSAKILPYL